MASFCQIQLDNFQGLYLPGNIIQGRLICSFNKPKNIRGIKIKLQGEERNSWSRTERYYDHASKKRRSRTIHYSGRNAFLRVEQALHGGGDVGPGRFELPFSFQLPASVPSTYQGHYGGIHFTLSAKVDRPMKFDIKDSVQLLIAALIDLNRIRGMIQLDPVAYSVDKMLCCCCCKSAPITMEVHLEKQAFVVGEVANVVVRVTNLSNKNVEAVSVRLNMEVESLVTSPRHDARHDIELLALKSDTGVGAHGERTYNFELLIPQITQIPNFSLCQLFSQKTKLKVTAVIAGVHSNMEVETLVTVGHVPILGSSQISGQQYPPNMYPPSMYPPSMYPPNIAPIHSTAIRALPPGVEPGPSAPPSQGGAWAPPPKGAGGDEYPPQLPGDPWSAEMPPPSYSEAVQHVTKK